VNDPYPAPCDPPNVACGGGNGDAFFERLVSIIYEREFCGFLQTRQDFVP
jgi:hypothetical protein